MAIGAGDGEHHGALEIEGETLSPGMKDGLESQPFHGKIA